MNTFLGVTSRRRVARSFGALFLCAMPIVGCGASPEDDVRPTAALYSALDMSDHSQMSTEEEKAAFGMNVMSDDGSLFSSPLWNLTVATYAAVMTYPYAQPLGQGMIARGLPTNSSIVGGPAGASAQGGVGGAADPRPNYGVPTGPSSSLGSFSALLCEYAERGCDRIMSCFSEAAGQCAPAFAQGDCQQKTEVGLRQRGVKSVPNVISTGLRCALSYMRTAQCNGDPQKLLNDLIRVCGR